MFSQHHFSRSLLLAAGIGALSVSSETEGAPAPPVAVPEQNAILATLRKQHPRLHLDAAGFERVRKRTEQEPLLKKWRGILEREGRKMLREAPSRYEIPDGKRLLATSRRVLHRVALLAFLYRMDRDHRWVDRAWKELAAAAEFKDWNPSHFLDTAEMTNAFALGYDWLYDAWSPEQRRTIREAIVRLGLTPGLNAYRGRAKYGWWVRAHHNWNQVCNGGLAVGALAIADEEPEIAAEILHSALRSLPRAMASFAPDGGWPEGPGYWNYATAYNVMLLSALQSALGTDFGLHRMEGFDKTGLFPIAMTAPGGRTFNFADCHAGVVRAPQLFWLARTFRQPLFAWYEKKAAAPSPFDLVFCPPPDLLSAPVDDLPLDYYFRRTEAASFRSSWTDPRALYLAFKAGDNRANHSHLDIGTFMLEADGRRWAVDLGSDNYNLPAYFGRLRWSYYRLRAEGHNTLVIDPGPGPDQDPRAFTRINRFVADKKSPCAVADITAAYREHAASVLRGFRLPQRRYALVQDEVRLRRPGTVWWFMHTPAQVRIEASGKQAVLTLDGETLHVHLLAPDGASFQTMDAAPLPSSPRPKRQGTNDGVRKLMIRVAADGDAPVRIAVAFIPGSAWAQGVRPTEPLRPLAEWSTDRP